MDRLTFIATIVGHLAWPVSVLVIVAVVLVNLPKLAKFIKTVKYKDWELTLREELSEAREMAEKAALESKSYSFNEKSTEKIERLVDIDTSIAIIEVWRNLESEVIKLIQHNGLMRYTRPEHFIEHLVKIGKLSEIDLLLFRKLRQIRNSAVHNHGKEPLSKAEVIEFSNFVDLLSGKMDAMKREEGYVDFPIKE